MQHIHSLRTTGVLTVLRIPLPAKVGNAPMPSDAHVTCLVTHMLGGVTPGLSTQCGAAFCVKGAAPRRMANASGFGSEIVDLEGKNGLLCYEL